MTARSQGKPLIGACGPSPAGQAVATLSKLATI
jgi:hypothetical protein